MPSRRIIKASDIVKDLRSGMADCELSNRYRLSAEGLQSVFKQLLDLKAISRSEMYDRLPAGEQAPSGEDVQVESLRKAPRYPALFPIPIYDGKNPKISGMLRDVNEHGVGVTGVETKPEEPRTFVILGDEFVAVEFETFAFDAVCRWVTGRDDEEPNVSGFEITSISERDLEQLRRLIQSLTFSESPK